MRARKIDHAAAKLMNKSNFALRALKPVPPEFRFERKEALARVSSFSREAGRGRSPTRSKDKTVIANSIATALFLHLAFSTR